MNAFIPKGLLDSDQQMVGEYTQKDVGLYSPFELMKDGAARPRDSSWTERPPQRGSIGYRYAKCPRLKGRCGRFSRGNFRRVVRRCGVSPGQVSRCTPWSGYHG